MNQKPSTKGINLLSIGDEKNIEKFISLFGKDKLEHILEKAPEHLSRRLAEIKKGLAEDNATMVHEAAHAIKGTTAQLYAIKLSQEAAEIMSQTSSLKNVRALMPAFEKTLDETLLWWDTKIKQ